MKKSVLLLILCCFCASVKADYVLIKDLYYTFNTNTKSAYVTRPTTFYYTSDSYTVPQYVTYHSEVYTVVGIYPNAFEQQTTAKHNIGSITLPSTIESIGDDAFRYNDHLRSITLPDGLQYIGDGSFYGCGLDSLTIPSTVTYTGSNAFNHCDSLSYVRFDGGGFVGDKCFANTRLSTIKIADGAITGFGSNVFSGTQLVAVTVPASVKIIGPASFANMPKLAHLNVDKNNKVFDNREDCNAVIATATNTLLEGCANTIIPSSVTKISESALANRRLTDIYIPSAVTDLEDYAIMSSGDNTGTLRVLSLPSCMERMGDKVFYGNNSLDSINSYMEEPPVIGQFTFSHYGTLHVPKGCASIYSDMEYWKKFKIVADLKIPDNRVYFTAFSATAGQSKTVPIYMIDDDAVSYVHFDLLFPEGTSLAKDSLGNPQVTYTDRLWDRYHKMEVTEIEGGIHVKIYSDNNYLIYENKGVLCNVTLNFADSMQAGNYYLKLTNIKLYTANKEYIHPKTITAKLTLSAASGIHSINASSSEEPESYYNLEGKLLSAPQKGINIIRYRGGKSKKVLK